MCAADLTPSTGAAADLRWHRCVAPSVTARRWSPSALTRKANVFASSPIACSHRRRVIPSISRRRWSVRILDWRQRYVLRQVLFDPFQMAASVAALGQGLCADRRISADPPQPDGGHEQPFRSDPVRASWCSTPMPDAAGASAARSSLKVQPRLEARQAQTAPSHRRRGRAQHGGACRRARAREARLRSVCARLVRRQCRR